MVVLDGIVDGLSNIATIVKCNAKPTEHVRIDSAKEAVEIGDTLVLRPRKMQKYVLPEVQLICFVLDLLARQEELNLRQIAWGDAHIVSRQFRRLVYEDLANDNADLVDQIPQFAREIQEPEWL